MAKRLLRVSTAGSVDDGKSTLIGRLLFDTKSILADQMAQVEAASQRRGFARTDLALLTDGLRAEREQGITIDVAYRYFATRARSFIVADTPGHVQYTRNMVTGASTSDVAIVLVDARTGLVDQSRRHLALASLLRVPRVVVAVNKIDLVGYDEARFQEIEGDVQAAAATLGASRPTVLPIAALHGDNVASSSDALGWYDGPTLLRLLETIDVPRAGGANFRFPVQWVIRPQTERERDYRGYAGTVASGMAKVGERVAILPSGESAAIVAIDTYEGALETAAAGRAVTLRLDRDVDVARGDLFAAPQHLPTVASAFSATLAWMAERPLAAGTKVLLKHATRTVRAIVAPPRSRLSIATLTDEPPDGPLRMNDIGVVDIRTTAPLAFEPYEADRALGGFLLIEESTGGTLAAGMIKT